MLTLVGPEVLTWMILDDVGESKVGEVEKGWSTSVSCPYPKQQLSMNMFFWALWETIQDPSLQLSSRTFEGSVPWFKSLKTIALMSLFVFCLGFFAISKWKSLWTAPVWQTECFHPDVLVVSLKIRSQKYPNAMQVGGKCCQIEMSPGYESHENHR